MFSIVKKKKQIVYHSNILTVDSLITVLKALLISQRLAYFQSGPIYSQLHQGKQKILRNRQPGERIALTLIAAGLQVCFIRSCNQIFQPNEHIFNQNTRFSNYNVGCNLRFQIFTELRVCDYYVLMFSFYR